MTRVKVFFMLFLMIVSLPVESEASFAGRALQKARNVMQSAFQLSFLHKLPVVFYKDHFNTMFEHANRSIDEMNIQYGDRTITPDEFQNDKKLHIKKSAELALHIQSLIGSKHLAYGITMVVGLIKEAIDGSFLNPGGSRSKEDVFANHVGARAVFGKEKFDASLNKHMKHFVKPEAVDQADSGEAVEIYQASNQSHSVSLRPNTSISRDENFSGGLTARQKLLKSYYQAAESGDAAAMQRISAELKALP